jgi:hypothetical protein
MLQMAILIFLGIPLALWLLVMLLSLPEVVEPREEEKPGLWKLYPDGAPQFKLDYSGKLWVEKKRKGFFKTLRRPIIPPDEPPASYDH